ncbi:MAG: T9SS type A sorting domain-containing protein [Bacteroidota bacterium]
MKKRFLFLFILGCMLPFSQMHAQTATSVTNGLFAMPTTWSCSCVPTPGYIIVVNHAVQQNISYGISSGSITINSGGSLIETGSLRSLSVSGSGVLTNHGRIEVSKLAFFTGATFSNDGIINSVDSLYLAVNLTQPATGSISVTDFYSGGTLINNGTINATNFFNAGTFTNNDTAIFTNHYNDNIGSNTSTLLFTNMTNAGHFTNTGDISGIDFTNNDTINNDAHLINNGMFYLSNDITNFDSITGNTSGKFCVENNSWNAGVMSGTFDFCDQTPPATAPFIDLNTGTIGAGITWCITPCSFGIESLSELSGVSLYPNPASGTAYLEFSLSSPQKLKVEMFNSVGQCVSEISNQMFSSGIHKMPVDVRRAAGLYLIRIQNGNKFSSFQISVQ